jgi:hypothetical protein
MGQISDFYENTTKVFTGVVTRNGTNPDLTSDTVTFMLKVAVDTPDISATIDVDATGLDSSGNFTITLSSEVTKITPQLYYYELGWYIAGSEGIHMLDQGTLTVKDKYQDNV